MSMLYRSLVCKFGGVQITLLCRLVKSGVGKTWVMGGGMWYGEVKMKVVKICFNRFSQKNSSRMGRKYSVDL